MQSPDPSPPSKTLDEATVDELVIELRKRTPCLVVGLIQETNSESTIKIATTGHIAARIGVTEMLKMTMTREAIGKISASD